jgi:hypothetical protein
MYVHLLPRGIFLKKLAFLAGAGALCAAAFHGSPLRAADHLDAPNVKMAANSMADINDVYAWMTTDGTKVNLALTVSPGDDGTRHFGPAIQYVVHVEQHSTFGLPGTETKILCTFVNDTSGQCWVVDADGATTDYVKGDFSLIAGRASPSNKFRVFAGRRSDPFFFNLSGFLTAKETVNMANVTAANAQGCPTHIDNLPITNVTTSALRTQLGATPDGNTVNGPCAQGVKDCFAAFNVMAIVIQVDKDLVIATDNKIVSVWASTHASP